MKTTSYFRNNVLERRTYLKTEWIEQALKSPTRTEVQPNGRVRCWAFIPEVAKYLHVVTEPDGERVHNISEFTRPYLPPGPKRSSMSRSICALSSAASRKPRDL